MNAIILAHDAGNPAVCGNKAARLADLKRAGFRVPPFVVIPGGVPLPERRYLMDALQACGADERVFAVRSSSTEEDSATVSYAGQFATYLNVSCDSILDRIADVRRSGASDSVSCYRDSMRLRDTEQSEPAVIIQPMIAADAAGVAFAADPVSGDPGTAVIAATRGLGDALVNGDTDGETWRVGRRGRRPVCDRPKQVSPALSSRQARRIARLVRKVSRRIGSPQDIEWATLGNRIYLLQSRDITVKSGGTDEPTAALWDNSNIVESYGGVTTPLTFSVARSAYASAYRQMGRVIGVSEAVIAANDQTYEQMIGLIDGRVYYNLLNWYRLLQQTPGFRYNQRFMEQMMGVVDELPDGELLARSNLSVRNRVQNVVDMARVAGRLLRLHRRHDQRVAAFHGTVDKLLAPVPLKEWSAEKLFDYYESLQSSVIPAWDTPLINDLYCMVFHGLLRGLCQSWLPPELAEVHNELLAGEPGIISLEPLLRMREMASLARADAHLPALLQHGHVDDIHECIEQIPVLRLRYSEYLQKFGDRCMDELKLESDTLADDPTPLFRVLGHLATAAPIPESGVADSDRQSQEHTVCTSLGAIKRFVFRRVLRLARARLRDRENMRFERTRVYGRVRAVFVEIGRRLASAGVLESSDDVFYLTTEDIAGFLHGTGASAALGAIAIARREEFATYRDADAPPRRFMTSGAPQLRTSRQPVSAARESSTGSCHSGQACSPGIVRGPVRIVRDPRTADVQSGDILVAERTDPGWVMIFPLVAGMIMERGSTLSHSAIVAREMGVPCIVGVEDACDWLADGQWVEIDGGTGTIRRLQQADEAA